MSARKAVAGLIVAAIGPAIVGNAIVPSWEEAGPVRIWWNGAVVLGLAVALHWAMAELGDEDAARVRELAP